MPFKHREVQLNQMLDGDRSILIHCSLNGIRRVGTVMKFNRHTTLVRIMTGAKSYFYTKRHNVKHNCKLYLAIINRKEHFINEDVYTTFRHEDKAS